MAKRTPPRVDPNAPIGKDVDLDVDDVRLPDGQRVTRANTRRIIEQGKRIGGRPSLTGAGKVSPRIAFRVPDQLRRLAEKVAASEHKSVSQLAREALEEKLSGEQKAG